MTEYICKEVQTDNGGYIDIVCELIRCRDCENYQRVTVSKYKGSDRMHRCYKGVIDYPFANDYCSRAERKEK